MCDLECLFDLVSRAGSISKCKGVCSNNISVNSQGGHDSELSFNPSFEYVNWISDLFFSTVEQSREPLMWRFHIFRVFV